MFRTTELWLEVRASDFLGIHIAAGASYDARDISKVILSTVKPAHGEAAGWQQHQYAVEFVDGKSLIFLSDRHPSAGFTRFARYIEEHGLIDAAPSHDGTRSVEEPGASGDVERADAAPTDEHGSIRIIEQILPIKKSVLSGRGKWQFKSGRSTLSLPIADDAWLKAFRAGRYPLSPGDALRVEVRCTVSRNERGDLIERIEEVTKVMEVVKPDIAAPG